MRRALVLGCLWLAAGRGAAAQTVTARVGGELTGFRYGYVSVPIGVDLSGAPGERLGSYTARLAWNPAVLSINCYYYYYGCDSLSGNFPTPQLNTDSVSQGVLRLTAVSPVGVLGLVTLATFRFFINDTVPSPLDLSFTEMSAAGPSFTNLMPALTFTSGTFCAARGRWGDLDRDGRSNSRDALLTLSKVVGLQVDTLVDTVSTSPLVVDTTFIDTGLADVDADSRISSRDALIILSHAVGIAIPGQRVLLLAASAACATGSARTLTLLPTAAELVLGQPFRFIAQAVDAGGRLVAPSGVLWRSSDYAVVGVDSGGRVTGRAPGTATITAELGPGIRATAAVTVLARRPNWYVDARQTGNPVQFGNAAFPVDNPLKAFPFVQDGDTIRVATGTYDFLEDGVVNAGVVILGGTPGDTTTRPLFRSAGGYYTVPLRLRGGLRTVVRNVVFLNSYLAIELGGVRSFVLEDSKVVGGPSASYGIYSCSNAGMDTVRIDRSVLLGDSVAKPGYGIYYGGCTPVQARLTQIRDSKVRFWSVGVYLFDSDSTDIVRTEVSDVRYYGVYVTTEYSGTPALHITQSRIQRDSSIGVYVQDTRLAVIDTSVVSDNPTGVYVYSSAGPLFMRGNNARNNQYGLQVYTFTGLRHEVHRNAFQGNQSFAIYAYYSSDSVRAQNNWWGVDGMLPGVGGADAVIGPVDGSSPLATEPPVPSYGGGGGGGGGPTANQVFMQNTAFNPATRTVSVGTTVTWVNQDGFTHTTSSSPGSAQTWDVTVGPGASTSVTFSAAGTYEYYCRIHGTPTIGMRGTIIVQ